MQCQLKIGDQSITVIEVRHNRAIEALKDAPIDLHRIVLCDAVSGEIETLSLSTESLACEFVADFLNPDGYPEGGLYDQCVTNKAFRM